MDKKIEKENKKFEKEVLAFAKKHGYTKTKLLCFVIPESGIYTEYYDLGDSKIIKVTETSIEFVSETEKEDILEMIDLYGE